MDVTLEYFESYRQKKKDLLEAIKENQIILERLTRQKDVILGLENEIAAMKKIITVMIDNDMDPVQAKLTTNTEDRTSSLWEGQSYSKNNSYATIDPSILSTVTSIISTGSGLGNIPNYNMVSTTGAIGASHHLSSTKIPGV